MMTRVDRHVAGILLAAGASRRFGATNKLTALIDGTPMVALCADALVCGGVDSVIAVTGHDGATVDAALGKIGINPIHNRDWHTGMASSLKCGIAQAICRGATHALIALGDMPAIRADHIASMLKEAHEAPDSIIRASAGDVPGNPVMLPASLFAAVLQLSGDEGARHLIGASGLPVICVDIGTPALFDIDDRSGLAAYRAV